MIFLADRPFYTGVFWSLLDELLPQVVLVGTVDDRFTLAHVIELRKNDFISQEMNRAISITLGILTYDSGAVPVGKHRQPSILDLRHQLPSFFDCPGPSASGPFDSVA